MKKYQKYLAGILVVLLIIAALVGLTAGEKSTGQDLRSHSWDLANDGETYTATFKTNNVLIISTGSIKSNYQYKLNKKNGQTYMVITTKSSTNQPEKWTYQVSKSKSNYNLKLDKQGTNDMALNATDDLQGNIQLMPK